MKKILFLASAHNSKDDRIFYHQAEALVNEHYNVSIFSFLEDKTEGIGSINICSKFIKNLSTIKQIKYCLAVLEKSKPQIILCDSPLTILCSVIYRVKNKCQIVYDITEWFPSKKNFTNIPNNNFLIKITKAILLTIINFLAGICSDVLMFGEYYKSIPFLLFFWKKTTTIHYYPNLQYIDNKKPRIIQNEIRLFYSGKFNLDKGIDKVVEVAKLTAVRNLKTHVKLNLVGFYENDANKKIIENLFENLPTNLTIEIKPFMDFEVFCETITNNDIFLDLRIKDLENNHCLPIKIFYYLATGRPVIYSDLKSIKKEIDTNKIGLFCNPDNTDDIVNQICDYIKQQTLYESHCQNSLLKSQMLYNWEKEKRIFINLIADLFSENNFFDKNHVNKRRTDL